MPYFRPSLAPCAAARMQARISRSFLRTSLGAALMYSGTVVGRFFGKVMVSIPAQLSVASFSTHATITCNEAAFPPRICLACRLDRDACPCMPANARHVKSRDGMLQEDGWKLPHECQPTSMLQDRKE